MPEGHSGQATKKITFFVASLTIHLIGAEAPLSGSLYYESDRGESVLLGKIKAL